MRPNLDPATILELQYEGGFVNHPKDPGGPTNRGITIAALSRHRGHPVSAADILALGGPEAVDIYEEVYAPAVRFDDLPSGVDLICYDAAINMGRSPASKFLQRALSVQDDGFIGKQTLSALGLVTDLTGLIGRIRRERENYYRQIDTFSVFGKGWLRRLTDVSQVAVQWAVRGGAA